MSKQLSPGPSSGRPLPSKSPSPKPPTPQPPTTAIEPTTAAADAASEEEEVDEFLPSGWDATSTASTSLTPSIHHHAFENGRRYHAYKYGRYPIPNDDLEQSREDMKHAMSLEVTDGRLFLAPIPPSPKKIIDIGTGTGIWAVEMGDLFPGAEILGLDLSPIQPVWIPPNVKFVIDDVEDEWANGGEWDFAHFRSMALVLKDLQRVVDQTFQ